jgi:hypothetical protein
MALHEVAAADEGLQRGLVALRRQWETAQKTKLGGPYPAQDISLALSWLAPSERKRILREYEQEWRRTRNWFRRGLHNPYSFAVLISRGPPAPLAPSVTFTRREKFPDPGAAGKLESAFEWYRTASSVQRNEVWLDFSRAGPSVAAFLAAKLRSDDLTTRTRANELLERLLKKQFGFASEAAPDIRTEMLAEIDGYLAASAQKLRWNDVIWKFVVE